jgi:hypothetical protein
LSDIYGKNRRIDRLLPGSIWDDPSDWMMGLRQQERLLQATWSAEHGSNMKNNIESIILVARAKSSDLGYLLLQYSFTNSERCLKEIEQTENDSL